MHRTGKLSVTLLTVALLAAADRGAAQATDHDSGRTQDRALRVAEAYLAQNPERARGLIPPDLDEKALTRANAITLEGGRRVLLNPWETVLIDFGSTLLASRDSDKLNRLYGLLLDKLPKVLWRDFPVLAVFEKMPLKRRQGITRRALLHIDREFPRLTGVLPPAAPAPIGEPNPIASCASETGVGSAGADSEISDRCAVAEYASDGLFANFSFPLKDDLTCIKDQDQRGTCVAHAIAAAVETDTLTGGGPAENLSEQHLYFWGETEVDADRSLTRMQEYGLPTSTVLDEMDARNYQIQFEREWPYNRSPKIKDPSVDPGTFTVVHDDSCDAYTDICSDYSFQSRVVVPLPGLPEPVRPAMPAIGAREVITTSTLPMDPIVTADITLSTAIMLLAADVPIVVSTTMVQNTSSRDYLIYNPAEPLGGGHAMLLVGYVEAADAVAAGAPTPVGDGYFIVKNSWGTGAHDCGFVYVDYAFFENHANYLVAVDAK